MPQRRLPVPAIALVVAGVVIGGMSVRVFVRRLPRAVSLDDVLSHRVHDGQAVRLPQLRIHTTRSLRTPDEDTKPATGDRFYSYTLIQDPDTGRGLIMRYWRGSFEGAVDEGRSLRAAVTGTLRAMPPTRQAELLARYGSDLRGGRDHEVILDDLEFQEVPPRAIAGAVVGLLLCAVGSVMGFQALKPAAVVSRPLPTVAAIAARGARRAGAAPAVAGKTRNCTACGQDSPIASRNCQTCKAPVEVEYFVVAPLPFEGFDRLVPALTGALQMSEYQAAQPLGRVHTPIPFQHVDAFQTNGEGATAPVRLASRGVSSLVAARAAAAALGTRGIEAVVVGSDEIVRGPFPRPATELSFDEEGVTFAFTVNGDRDERRIAWSRVSLVVFSAAVPLRGTMTIARDERAGAPADPSGYRIDLYEREREDGVRVAEDSFHHWSFLGNSGSERPADRYGKLMEIFEARARSADIQYVTGLYRGPRSEWRMNFYSRFCWLAGEKRGWQQQAGPPRLEGYEVMERIGQGGMGSVYRAKQKKLGRIVAIKVIAPQLGKNEHWVKRFDAEARAVASLSHPNIVQVIDLAESAGRHFMVMEYVAGETLLQRLKARGRMSEVEALGIGIQVAEALAHAASRGIIHRDVKPDNIFLTGDSGAKLGDWGLAKELDQDLGLTDTGTALGTPYYMSPEQARASRDIDVRSDFYGLAATLYHALVGVPPFRGGSPAEVISQHLSAPPPDARMLRPDVTAATAELLRRLMAKRAEARTESPEAAIRDLQAALVGAEASSLVGV